MGEGHPADIAIRGVVARLVQAWNAHDARDFAAEFGREADFTNVFGMRTSGRHAIEQLHATIFRTMFRDSHLTVANIDVRMLRPDVAAVDVRWDMTGARDPHGREWPRRRGLLSAIATDNGADWSLAVVHNMDLPDEGAVAAIEALQARTT